jgi:hypothetical protein
MIEDVRLDYLVGLAVLNGGKRPAWYPGDEFEAARKRTLEQAAAGGK